MALVTRPTSSSSDPAFHPLCTAGAASPLSALLLHLLVAPWFQLHQLLFHGVAEGTEGSFSCLWPCEQNCAILWDMFTLLGGVECWRLPRWKSTGIAVQWAKLRGKLEVLQNSVHIQLHTLEIERENTVWLCPEALTVYIVQWENQKISLQVVESCDLANVCVWNPVYLAFQILTL